MRHVLFFICFLLAASVCYAQNDSLYAFVGEKISLTGFNATVIDSTSTPGVIKKSISMDNAFKAKYKILKNVYNHYDKDTIEFEAYDHYGNPGFSKYKYVLLFVMRKNGKLYHCKYQFFDVYPTKDGRWASPGDPYRFDDGRYDEDERYVKAQKIKFKKSITVDLSSFSKKVFDKYFAPYYAVKDKKRARPIKGAYVDDLFEIKAEGVLAARGEY